MSPVALADLRLATAVEAFLSAYDAHADSVPGVDRARKALALSAAVDRLRAAHRTREAQD